MNESIDDTGADAKAGERAGAFHEIDFSDIVPIFAVFL